MKRKKTELSLIDVPHYSYWQALYHAFYSGKLYIDVGKRWQGFGFSYLLLACAIVCIPFALKIMLSWNVYFKEAVYEPLNALPPLVVQNGKVQYDKPMPALFKNPRGQVVAIVDTINTYKNFPGKQYPDLAFLITKDTVFYNPTPLPVIFENQLPMWIRGDN